MQLTSRKEWASEASDAETEESGNESEPDYIEFEESEEDETEATEIQEVDKEQAEMELRDEAFINSLSFFVGRSLTSEGNLTEISDDQVPTRFICFKRTGSSDERIFVLKASLIWWLSDKEKRSSSDRIYRFINDRNAPAEVKSRVGDFIVTKVKRVDCIAQILAFRFIGGKQKFYGDVYYSSSEDGVEYLCNFLEENRNGTLVNSSKAQRWVNVKNYRRHITLKRDIPTGNVTQITQQ